MNKIKKDKLYDEQIELINISMDILKKWLSKYKKDDKYKHLFYEKSIPAHISQVLLSTKNKISFKPLLDKIKTKHWLSTHLATTLIRDYWYSEVIRNWKELADYYHKYRKRK